MEKLDIPPKSQRKNQIINKIILFLCLGEILILRVVFQKDIIHPLTSITVLIIPGLSMNSWSTISESSKCSYIARAGVVTLTSFPKS